ncbi:hypothetical protein PoB_002573100 [Plakobranchus ocellatus]|uniref:Uncharacterized protein n=1 Tax=Plakobranchus ocellatus TaxID=259542 RepID=A0AAV3ZTC5_9GAST|nr:hypothetical protein PoB_002573100 [Plakobranchus ocellatus]
MIYRINVSGKEKTFHADLLKRYITRDAVSDEALMDEGYVSAVNLAVAEDDDEGSSYDGCGCEALPGFCGWSSKETVKNLKLGDKMSRQERRQSEKLAGSFFSLFSVTCLI